MQALKFLLPLMLAALVQGCQSVKTYENEGICPPGSSTTNPQTNIKVKLGLWYFQHHHIALAKQTLIKALQADPKDLNSLDAYAYIMAATGNRPVAEKMYRKALQLYPYSGRATANYGVFLCEMGKYKAGLKYLSLAIDNLCYTNTSEALNNAVLCAKKSGNTDKVDYYKRALRHLSS